MPHPLCTVHVECCMHVAESLYPLYISFQLHGMVSPPPIFCESIYSYGLVKKNEQMPWGIFKKSKVHQKSKVHLKKKKT